MQTIKIKAPAKINLTLDILNKREDGFHNIESIMQTVSLYDVITITIDENIKQNRIEISGNNPQIPYDKTNLAYISAEKFLKEANITGYKINIYLEKYIPVAAGLAGGSSDAAAVLYGLNKMFNNILESDIIDNLASQMGSDINFCLHGGTQVASSRGEILKKIQTPDLNIIIVKPKDIFISAREAYNKYSALINKPQYQSSELMIRAINENNLVDISKFIHNGLENAILPDYPQLQKIKNELLKAGCLNTIMSGSGPSIFGILPDKNKLQLKFCDCDVFYTETINTGVTA
jgi:4-diphosphocytidyl-2-C-methyl-D-erythritol kinase